MANIRAVEKNGKFFCTASPPVLARTKRAGNEVWLPLRIQNGTNKPVTVTFHRNNAKRLTEYFKGRSMQKITAIDIQRYLTYLRTEYRSTRGKPLATKTVCHLYATLGLIFSYVKRQEVISKNPLQQVEAPRKERKPVDALDDEEAARFFRLLPTLPPDFHCMLMLFVTTGLRRSELVGLKWEDIDENASTMSIKRGAVYTAENGIYVNGLLPRKNKVFRFWESCGIIFFYETWRRRERPCASVQWRSTRSSRSRRWRA